MTLAKLIGDAYGDLIDTSSLTEIKTTHGWTNENYFVGSRDNTRKYILRVNAAGTKSVESLRFEYSLLEKMRERYNVSVVPKIVSAKDDTFVDVPGHGLCVLFELCEGEHESVIDLERNEAHDIVTQVAHFLGSLHTFDFSNINTPSDRKNDVNGALGDEIIRKQRELLNEHFNDQRLQHEMDKNETLRHVISELVRLHGVFFPTTNDGTFVAEAVPLGLIHNDFHYDNVLFKKIGKNWELSAALDWELSYVGPCVIDVALGLYFWCSCYSRNVFAIDIEYARLFINTYETARKSRLTTEEKSLIKRAMLVSIYWSVEFVTNPREDMMRKDLQAVKYDMCLVYLQRYLSVLTRIASQTDQAFLASIL
jgi:Ser/Thr protein kinase RdoA (MazF antagonist)